VKAPDAPPIAPRQAPRPALGLVSVLVAIGAALGFVAWKAWRDPDIAWLSRESPASWIRYPSPAATRANFIVRMTTDFRTSFTLDGLPDHLTDEISHFFEVYKALEPEKYSSVRGWEGAEAAWQEIQDCQRRYRAKHPA